MRISDFELYRALLLRYSGLSLTPEQSYLLDSRLTPIARKWGYPTLDAMTLSLRGLPDSNLLDDVIEAMSSHDTSFFREMESFTTLRDILIPHLVKSRGRRQRQLRIWSAACATGQEAYCIAMILREMETHLKGWKVNILGTDISAQAIRKARAVSYTQFEIQRGLPVSSLIKHFQEKGDLWQLNDNIRNLVHFEQGNLIEPFEHYGLFDIIFCRNALTGFEEEIRLNALNRLGEQLAEDGFLVLGSDERLDDLQTNFRFLDIGAGIYGHKSGHYRLNNTDSPS